MGERHRGFGIHGFRESGLKRPRLGVGLLVCSCFVSGLGMIRPSRFACRSREVTWGLGIGV